MDLAINKTYQQEETSAVFDKFQEKLVNLRRLRCAADRDVTGVLRRSVFFERLENWRRYSLGGSFVICLIELSDANLLYQKYGSVAVSTSMECIGRLLNKSFGIAEIRGRYLSNSFIVAFPGVSASQCRPDVKAVLEQISSMSFSAPEPFSVSCCAGLSQYPLDEDSIENLCKSAERKLWLATRQGKSQICI